MLPPMLAMNLDRGKHDAGAFSALLGAPDSSQHTARSSADVDTLLMNAKAFPQPHEACDVWLLEAKLAVQPVDRHRVLLDAFTICFR